MPQLKTEGRVEINKSTVGYHTRAIAENGQHLHSSVEHFTTHDAALGNIRAAIELYGGTRVEVHDYSIDTSTSVPKKFWLYRDGSRQDVGGDTNALNDIA